MTSETSSKSPSATTRPMLATRVHRKRKRFLERLFVPDGIQATAQFDEHAGRGKDKRDNAEDRCSRLGRSLGGASDGILQKLGALLPEKAAQFAYDSPLRRVLAKNEPGNCARNRQNWDEGRDDIE